MDRLNDIAAPVATDFGKTKELLKSQIGSQHPMLGSIAQHLLSFRGKMMRPLLCLLAAKLHNQPTEKSHSVAATFELIHNATLVHDDVIDEAYTRHDELTLGALIRSRSAVLVGDYLFSKGLVLASKAKAYREIDIAIDAIEALVEGELRQSKNAQTLKVDREEYFRVVNLKTSSLIAASAMAGASSVGATIEEQQVMYRFGQEIGRAFQIQDDILDYTSGAKSGKREFNDIKERKITLPLIMAIEVGGSEIIRDLRGGNIERVAKFVNDNQGVNLAAKECQKIVDSSIKLLDAYPHCGAKQSLIEIAYFATARNR